MKMAQQITQYVPKMWRSFSSFSMMSASETASRNLFAIK
jgi:hypothetical protein